MRTGLRVAIAAFLVVFAVPAAGAPAHHYGRSQEHYMPPHHGKPKPGLPPIDTSEAQNCDFIAEP